MKLRRMAFMALLIGATLTSCENVDDGVVEDPPQVSLGDYENGILINGEGAFGNGNASINFISNDLSTNDNTIFSNVNDKLLGDTSQSITFADELAYIVVNNSNKIEVVNRYSFESVATIDRDLTNPRYMAISNGKGYVTNWGDTSDDTDDFITVINLNTYSTEYTTPASLGPEQILAKNGKLYISQKGFISTNNRIRVMDTNTNLSSSIIVNDVPDELFFDNNGNLVVLSEGGNTWNIPSIETKASITKIDLTNDSIIANLEFPLGVHPSLMTYDDGMIYYILNNELYGLGDTDTTLPNNSLLSIDSEFAYGMAVKEGRLYITDASFIGPSKLLVYDLNLGIKIDYLEVPLGASKIYFNDK